jgi:hypothetical protein
MWIYAYLLHRVVHLCLYYYGWDRWNLGRAVGATRDGRPAQRLGTIVMFIANGWLTY